MRCVALLACGLTAGTMIIAGLAPVRAQEWPVETAALAKSAPAASDAPAATAAPATAAVKPPVMPPAAATNDDKKNACAGVIGTSRTIVAGADTPQHIGLMQYKTSLPLKDHEVVLTFDDGPIHTYTPRVLDILAANCVKATFFLVGSMADAYPRLVRRIYNEGHSIGTHSQHHPLTFNRMAEPAIAREVDTGIASVEAAAGDPRAVAPFFRVPGLKRSKRVDAFLAAHSLIEWSADEVADDWHHGITPQKIVRLAMQRIAARDHRGVLLLHDIHPATAKALPTLLAELKAHGYHIVHVAPAGERPKLLPPLPATMVAQAKGHHKAHRASAKRHRHVARRLKRHRKVVRRRHRVHHARRASAQSLSALSHKTHRSQTVARNHTRQPSAW